MKKPYRLAARLPLDPAEIGADAIAEAFRAARVPVPHAAELRRLARVFTGYKQVFFEAAAAREINTHARAVAEAVAALRRSLPPLHEHCRVLAAAGDPFGAWRHKAMTSLRSLLDREAAILAPASALPDGVRDWRWFAPVAASVLGPALKSAGTSKTGPLARVLARIVPLVSGETPTPAAVGQQLAQIKTGNIRARNIS